jgi:hypothetical protein
VIADKMSGNGASGAYSAISAFPELKPGFDLVDEIINTFHQVLTKSELRYDDTILSQRRRVAFFFSLKAVKTTWAATCLIEKGCPEDANILIRSLIETVVNTNWLCLQKQPMESVKQFLTTIKYKRLEALNKIHQAGQWSCPEPFDHDKYISVKAEYEEMIRANPNSKKLWDGKTLLERMEHVGMANVYRQEYELFSSHVHADPSAIESYFEATEDSVHPFPQSNQEFLRFSLSTVVIFLLEQMRVFVVLNDADASLVDGLEKRAGRVFGLVARPTLELGKPSRMP